MKDLFKFEVLDELVQRINKLTPETQGLWGKMDVAQMLAHCVVSVEVALGDKNPPRMFRGRIFGPLFKRFLTNKTPLKKSTPTAPSYLVIDQRNFKVEKDKLIQLLTRLSKGGSQNTTKRPHPFFGNLKPEEWSLGTYKHIDHHLQQFGV